MNDTGAPASEAQDLTKDERDAIAARTPPYDGVRTIGDLLHVRALLKQAKAKPTDK